MSDLFTVGDLRRHLDVYSDDTKLTFPGGLNFYRLKSWGDDEAIVEFNEPQGSLSDVFKKKNPSVKVVFMRIDDIESDESGVVGGPIDMSVR